MSRGAQIAVSLAISALALWFCLRGVDLAEVGRALAATRWAWLVPMGLAVATNLWLRAERWGVLLGTVARIERGRVFSATCIGFMGNMLLPLRAGEAIRPLVVVRGGGITWPAALATCALDRLLDLMMLGVCAAAALAVVPADPRLEMAARALAVMVVGGVVALLLVARHADTLEGWLEKLAPRLPAALAGPVHDGGRSFLLGVKGLSDLRTFLQLFALSALVWATSGLSFSFGLLAMNLPLPFLAVGLAATVIVAAAVSVPSAPGFLGTFQAGSIVTLGLWGVPETVGFTFGMLTWLVQMVVIVGLGMMCLSRLHVSLGEMAHAAEELSEPIAETGTAGTDL